MILNIKRNYEEIVISVGGRLDDIAAPILEKTITENVNINDNLVFDFKSLNYISKAGFQVLVKTKEKMSDGFMTIKNVCDEIIKDLEVNGFIDDFIIE